MRYDMLLKENVVREYFDHHIGYKRLGIKYNVPRDTVRGWIEQAKRIMAQDQLGLSKLELINITNEIKEKSEFIMDDVKTILMKLV